MEKRTLAEELVRHAWRLITEPNKASLAQAVGLLNMAILYDPEHEYAWYWKGVALHMLNKNQEALECFEKSIVVDKGFPESWYHKGNCLLALGKTQDSVEAFQNALLQYSDPDPRSRAVSYDTFRRLVIPSEIVGWENAEQSRRLYERRMIIPTIQGLTSSYNRLFFLNKSSQLIQRAQKILEELGLPIPDGMKKDYESAKLMDDTMRNLGMNLELKFPEGFPDPNQVFSKENPELHRALMLALACRHEEAFAILRESSKVKSRESLQLLFATLLLDSVPYRSDAALNKQGVNPEKRKQRLQEAEKILNRIIEAKDLGSHSEKLSIVNAALNNRAAAMIHLADYSTTWDDVVKRHIDADEIFGNLVKNDPTLKAPKLNFIELNFVMRVMAQEPKKNPHFLEEFKKVGLGLTEIRDFLCVLRGTEVKIELLEEMKKTIKDPTRLSIIQEQIETMKKEQTRLKAPDKSSLHGASR